MSVSFKDYYAVLGVARSADADAIQRAYRMLARKHGLVAHDLEVEQQAMPDLDTALDDDIGDEMLRLIFTACHPL